MTTGLDPMMRDYLAARRRAKQADKSVQYYTHGPRLKQLAEASGQTHAVTLSDKSYSLHFRWHGRRVNYMITTGSMTVMQGGRTVLRTGVTPDKFAQLLKHRPAIDAFPLDGELP